MTEETLNIFDEDGSSIGTAPRDEVHREGYWHETFHCWFVEEIRGEKYIYFQLRSQDKKDYPEHYDTTAAGHLRSHETAHEGMREIDEELGIRLSLEELNYVGKVPDEVESETFIDREFCHMYLYNINYPPEFDFMDGEVSAMVKLRAMDFKNLWFGLIPQVELDDRTIAKSDIAPHSNLYFETLLRSLG